MRPALRHRLLGDDPAAGPDRGSHAAQDGNGGVHVQEHEAAERQVERLGQGQLLGRLGQRHDLGLGGRRGRGRHLVSPGRVGVDGVHPAVPADHAGQRHGDVAAAGSDVRALPPLPQAEPVQGRHQRSAVDVVAQFEFDHGWRRYGLAGPQLR